MTKSTPTFDNEQRFLDQGYFSVIGVDEAGRGPWAGPVVAAAVILDPTALPNGLNDSKKLSERRREELFDEINRLAQVGVGRASVEEIDEINILRATLLAMERAVDGLRSDPTHSLALIDGNKAPALKCETVTLVKGDARSLSIAAASIIAKVTRDRIMRKLDISFPQYCWARNKGYGTADHIAALDHHGPCAHHRTSFKPIALRMNSKVSPKCNALS